MNISIWYITYQYYDEKINQSLNTCILLVRGRSDLFNSGGRWSKGGGGGGRDILKIQGELAKRGEFKNSGVVWTLDEAMSVTRTIESVSLYSPVTDSRH